MADTHWAGIKAASVERYNFTEKVLSVMSALPPPESRPQRVTDDMAGIIFYVGRLERALDKVNGWDSFERSDIN